jgi:hypothetical protein
LYSHRPADLLRSTARCPAAHYGRRLAGAGRKLSAE